MLALRNVLLVFLAVVGLTACSGSGKSDGHCGTREQCLNDPNCRCWCSQICNWRKKGANDHPFYVENDPHGKHCYCKQWDYEHYEDNCIKHLKVKQPPGAR